MDVREFQDKIAKWRSEAGLKQPELDEACGFLAGTVGRIERGTRKMSEEEFIQILAATKRDLVWTLLESCGALYAQLQPLETDREKRMNEEKSSHFPQEDEELRSGLDDLLAGIQVVLTKIARAADRKRWISDILIQAALPGVRTGSSLPSRVRKPRKAEVSDGG